MIIEFIEREVNYEPIRIMLRRGIATGNTQTVTYMQKIVVGAQVLRKNQNDFANVDSSVLIYSAVLEKRSKALLDTIDANNLRIEDFEKLLEFFK